MSRKRKSPVGVKIIACLLLLGSLAALALPWIKLAAEVGPNQTRMSPGELIQNFAGLDAAAVLDSVRSELTAAGVQLDVSPLSDLLHRVLDGRFLPHEMGIACRDLSAVCRAAHRLDLAGTMETLAYGVWGVFGLLALLGFIALLCQLTDHRGGIVPYFLLGALITGGLLYLRQTANDYLVRESENLLSGYGLSVLVQHLGINVELVKMGIGAYLCPFLALLSLLLMGIKKKEAEPRYEASPYPARRSETQQSRSAEKVAAAWQEMSGETGKAAATAPRPTQTAAPRPTQTAAPRPTQTAAPRPTQSTAPRPTQSTAPRPAQSAAPAAAAAIQAGRVPLPGEQSWTCAYCGRRMEADKNFCDLCGSTRPKRREALYCSACGARLRPDARFCSNCGRSVVSEEKTGGTAGEV